MSSFERELRDCLEVVLGFGAAGPGVRRYRLLQAVARRAQPRARGHRRGGVVRLARAVARAGQRRGRRSRRRDVRLALGRAIRPGRRARPAARRSRRAGSSRDWTLRCRSSSSPMARRHARGRSRLSSSHRTPKRRLVRRESVEAVAGRRARRRPLRQGPRDVQRHGARLRADPGRGGAAGRRRPVVGGRTPERQRGARRPWRVLSLSGDRDCKEYCCRTCIACVFGRLMPATVVAFKLDGGSGRPALVCCRASIQRGLRKWQEIYFSVHLGTARRNYSYYYFSLLLL